MLNLKDRAIERVGNAGQNSLFGNAQDNVPKGGAGRDTPFGNRGNDRLVGGKGQDTYAFEMQPDAETNVDALVFRSNDRVALSDRFFDLEQTNDGIGKAFTNITTGTIGEDSRILYDQDTGEVFYDTDGSGGDDAVLCARVAGSSDILTADGFFVF
ncbi:calcium-binding protein [Chachezhania sediminis]|uniref:hypothetical protein n=1 Tax=Chachezhania sediminis TaxID=2599291 RepID=UPI00131EAF4D|nr:hypothetical protein [Chachezhania sediminis]